MSDGLKSDLGPIREELKTLSEQGCDTWELERKAELIEREAGPDARRRVEELWEAAGELKPSADFAYEEPSDLEQIRARRPEGPRRVAAPLSEEQLRSRTLGAWLGRISGCMLGKPVEGWSRQKIRDMMDACEMERLDDYLPVPPEGAGLAVEDWKKGMLRGNFDRGRRDDDVDYTIAGLRILEEHGTEFTPRQVADFWLGHLPYHQTYTAERVAYRNFVNGIWPPASAAHRNPFREWIGAQIRADAFGYACPARPEQAAALAFKDASVSHTRNGIYGEMWVAAMLAAAFVAGDPEKVVRLGLTEIPARCRLAEALNLVLDWRQEGCGADEATDRVLDQFGHYSGVHTINNAAIVALALLWGEKNFTRTIGLAVEAGLDTDCNGATAGSVAGALIGAQSIPAHWTDPLNDRTETAIFGEGTPSISGLAERTRHVQQAD